MNKAAPTLTVHTLTRLTDIVVAVREIEPKTRAEALGWLLSYRAQGSAIMKRDGAYMVMEYRTDRTSVAEIGAKFQEAMFMGENASFVREVEGWAIELNGAYTVHELECLLGELKEANRFFKRM